jgi:hypothetical protein
MIFLFINPVKSTNHLEGTSLGGKIHRTEVFNDNKTKNEHSAKYNDNRGYRLN